MQVHQTPTLLLTRPLAASQRFAEGLTGAKIVIAPLMEIVGTGAQVDLEGATGLILTSEAAVAFLPETTLPAFCVGPRTAQVARERGLHTEVLGPDAEGLIAALATRTPPGRLVHLHGTHTRGDIVGRLRAAGLAACGTAIYDQRDVPATPEFSTALTQPGLIVPLFSPRSAKLFARNTSRLRPDTRLVALSAAVAQALPPPIRAQSTIVAEPTGLHMDRALAHLGVKRNCP